MIIYFRYLENDGWHHGQHIRKLRYLAESYAASNKNKDSTELHPKGQPLIMEVNNVIADKEGHRDGGNHERCPFHHHDYHAV